MKVLFLIFQFLISSEKYQQDGQTYKNKINGRVAVTQHHIFIQIRPRKLESYKILHIEKNIVLFATRSGYGTLTLSETELVLMVDHLKTVYIVEKTNYH